MNRRRPLEIQFALTVVVAMGTVGAVASLALALGFIPLDFPHAGQLVEVWERGPTSPVIAFSDPDLAALAAASPAVFAGLGAFTSDRARIVDRGGIEPASFTCLRPRAFAALDSPLLLGRRFQPNDPPIGSDQVSPVWISYDFWQKHYGGSPAALGAEFALANAAGQPRGNDHFRVAGILPERARIPRGFTRRLSQDDFWCVWPGSSDRHSYMEFGLGRLRRGVDLAQAQAVLQGAADQLGQHYPFDRHKRIVVASLEAIAQGPARRTGSLLILGIGLAFLAAAVNLALMMITEGLARRREMLTRTVLGASPERLWRQQARRTCALALAALALGWGLAAVLIRVLVQLLPAAGLGQPLLRTPPLNPAVLGVLAALAIAAALAWPAVLVRLACRSGGSKMASLQGSGPGAGYPRAGPRRWRVFLLGSQAGAGAFLLVAAGLAARTFIMLSSPNLGPAPDRTFLIDVRPAGNSLPPSAWRAFDRDVLARFAQSPGTEAAAFADDFPPPSRPGRFVIRGDADARGRIAAVPDYFSPEYFRTLAIPVLFGRAFSPHDAEAGAPPVTIINLQLAQQNWPNPRNAVGAVLTFDGFAHPFEVVGIVGNFTGYWSHQPVARAYLPGPDLHSFGGTVIVRTTRPVAAVIARARQALASASHQGEISSVSSMRERWITTVARPRARMTGMLLLALLGLALSFQGVYAVAAAAAEARRHELAVRSCLGAPPLSLAWTLTRGIMTAVAAGALAGLAAALALGPALAHWLGFSPDGAPGPMLLALAVLLAAAALASLGPALAAARSDPATTLRLL
ncbi:MAG: ABC transporter permease [Terriglobales bacterium]